MEKNIPNHIGIIMDGNRRWARERNLPDMEGHLVGYQKMQQAPGWFFDLGVKIVSVFAFSTENWNRSQEEVNFLMKLLRQSLSDNLEEFNQKGYKLLISGKINELPGDLPEICQEAIVKTQDNINGILNICLNYGGRAEIVDAVKKMIKNKIELEQVHEGMLRKYLYHGELDDPSIIIRTSGEQRLSGFQLWQSSYSELFFLKKYWPEFEEEDARLIVEEYDRRKKKLIEIA